jgi:predicted pyridoxine 5'-phosphate oxidase superfamily flavin-nucleotide-binding protein
VKHELSEIGGNWMESTSAKIKWHEGERFIQDQISVPTTTRNNLNSYIKTFMPAQHQELFNKLPYFAVGTIDSLGRPWASIISGNSGFLSSETSNSLKISTTLSDADPFVRNLKAPFEGNE